MKIILFMLTCCIVNAYTQNSTSLYIKYPVLLLNSENDTAYYGMNYYSGFNRVVEYSRSVNGIYAKTINEKQTGNFNRLMTDWIISNHKAPSGTDRIMGSYEIDPFKITSEIDILYVSDSAAYYRLMGARSFQDLSFSNDDEHQNTILINNELYDSLSWKEGDIENSTGYFGQPPYERAYRYDLKYFPKRLSQYPNHAELHKYYEKWHFNKHGKIIKDIKGIALSNWQDYTAPFVVDQGSKRGNLLYEGLCYDVYFDREESSHTTMGNPNFDLFLMELMNQVKTNRYKILQLTSSCVDSIYKYRLGLNSIQQMSNSEFSYEEYIENNDSPFYYTYQYDSFPPSIGYDSLHNPVYNEIDTDGFGNPLTYSAIAKEKVAIYKIAGLRFYEDWYLSKDAGGIIKDVKAVQLLLNGEKLVIWPLNLIFIFEQ